MTSKVIVIVGPTAVGKTELSLRIAQKYHTEIISGDSIAVYKGLDIGSAKPSLEEQKKIKHHLINILNPQEDYSVAEFQAQARSIIETLPISIICGGTGLYIQAALFQYEFKAKKRNPSLEKQYASYTNEELFSYLLSIDPMLDLNKIHPNNRKRVLRAIEVKKSQGSSIHSFQHKNEPLYDYFIVYLNMERDLLYQRIHERVDTMIKQGLKEDVTALREAGIYPKGIGYKEWDAYFKGEASLEDVIELIKKNTRHLAKRQETWFKNQMNTHMYMLNATNRQDIYLQIENDIERWLKK